MNKPKTRQDCMFGPRPCPWISCGNHAFWFFANYERNNELRSAGRILSKMSDEQILDFIFGAPETCVADLIDRGPLTLEEIGKGLNLTREYIRQIEKQGKKKIEGRCGKHRLREFWRK